jgi:lysozyme family protein
MAAEASVCWEGEEMLTSKMRDEYARLFATCTVRKNRKTEVEGVITRMMKARDRYEQVSHATGVPWFIIAVIHNMECAGRFDCHLHNGDPLRARTVQVPKGRPVSGSPPFRWETSAVDALTFDGFDAWTDWSVSGTLYKLEAFNGLGYRKRKEPVPTPYLWAATPHYEAGKYVRDGKFDPKAVSGQIGAAALLRRMSDQHLIEFGDATPPTAELREARVTASVLNLRQAASDKAHVTEQLRRGVIVTIVSEAPGGWANVRLANGETGWVASRYLAPIGEEQA